MPELNHNFEEWIDPTSDTFELRRDIRFFFSYGGRGGGKSHGIAEDLILFAHEAPLKILCAREFMNSIDDSVYALLESKVNTLVKSGDIEEGFFQFKNNKIYGANGSLFTFMGTSRNIGSIKSKEGYHICWIEEGQYISQKAWELLEPTIRDIPDSDREAQFIISMNRESDKSILDKVFIQNTPPKRSIVTKVNYTDNPYHIPLLIEMAEECKRRDYQSYCYIWLGELNSISKAQVLHGKWRVAKFKTPEDAIFYHGADWSNGGSDPHTLNRSFVSGNTLYIDYEMETNLDFQFLPALWEECPSLEANVSQGWTVYCDDARNDLIRMMSRKGFDAKPAAKKWKGVNESVKAGITYLRGFDEIVIHERCVNTIDNAQHWKYKVDDRSGDVTPILAKGNEHHFAGTRYAHIKNIINTSKRKR